MSLSLKLARRALNITYDQLPADVIHQVKRVLLDTIACALAAFSRTQCKLVKELILSLGGTAESTIIGSNIKTSCINATLVNSVMVRYLDFNDMLLFLLEDGRFTGAHASDSISPILAVAERQHCTGAEFIVAVVSSYEVMGRLASGARAAPEQRGWHSSMAFTPYGVAVGSGKILGLDEERITNAMGIAGAYSQTLSIADHPKEQMTMLKGIAPALIAQNGLLLALLAERGHTGPHRILEGASGFIQVVLDGRFDSTALTSEDGKYIINQTILKPFVADGSTQGHLFATVDLVRRYSIKPEDVMNIEITAGQRCVEHTGGHSRRRPMSKEEADHSSYYLTAIAIKDGEVGPEQHTLSKIQDPLVHQLIDKVTLKADNRFFHQAGQSRITTNSGKTYLQKIEYPKGHFKNPMSDPEIEVKFRRCAQNILSEHKQNLVVDAVWSLENMLDISKLTNLLTN